MKKLFFSISFLLACTLVQAQDDSTTTPLEDRQSEVRLNGLYLVAGAFEGSYSYILNEESAVGVSLLIPIDSDVADDVNYYVSPYYRFFFGKKPAAGFFLEGFGMLNSINENITEFDNFGNFVTNEETITDFALGIGLGGKFMTKRGLVGEVNVGIGRNLFNSDSKDFGTEIVGRGGISIGYRF